MPVLKKTNQIPIKGDDRGLLCVAEIGAALPFIVRRAYWIYGTQPGVSRGFHAHKRLNQWCVCLAGAVRLKLFDGETEDNVQLDSISTGLLIGPGLWHEMHDFTPNCILLVFADMEYDETDYIRNYDEFLAYVHTP